MEKKQKAIQVYAIIICIISVITILISLSSLVSALIDRGDPLYANNYALNLTSFENFKMEVLKSTQKDQAYIPNDQTLHKMYEDAKADKINLTKHQTHRTIVVSSLITFFCIILFGTHWWIIKKINKEQLKN